MVQSYTTTAENSTIIPPQAQDVLGADELAMFRRMSDKVSAARDAWKATQRRDNPDSLRLDYGAADQTALADGFARSYLGVLSYDRNAGEWLVWGIQGWEPYHHLDVDLASYTAQHIPLMDTEAKNQDVRNRWLNQGTYHAMADYAKTILGRTFDADGEKVGLPLRQVLDTTTGDVRGMYPNECIRRRLPDAVEWLNHDDDPDVDQMAVSRKWIDFLDEALSHYQPIDRLKIAAFLKQWVGAALAGDTRDECAIFFFGKRGSGKSTIIETLAELFGAYHAGIAGARLTANSNQHLQWIAALDGARLATVGELPGKGEWPGHLLNQVISGENVTANRMRQNDTTFRSKAHLMVAGNHRPKADANDGIWRRLALIQCQHQPEAVNKHLKAELLAELPGILNWAIEGLQAWIRNGRELDIPDVVLADTDEYRADADPMERWYMESLAVEPDAFTPTDALHAHLTDWWQRNISGDTGRTPSKKRLGDFLSGRGYSAGTARADGVVQRGRFGVVLCQQ